jgi:hypothetical protein
MSLAGPFGRTYEVGAVFWARRPRLIRIAAEGLAHATGRTRPAREGRCATSAIPARAPATPAADACCVGSSATSRRRRPRGPVPLVGFPRSASRRLARAFRMGGICCITWTAAASSPGGIATSCARSHLIKAVPNNLVKRASNSFDASALLPCLPSRWRRALPGVNRSIFRTIRCLSRRWCGSYSRLGIDRVPRVVVQGSLSRRDVAELALKYRLPAATVPRSFAEVRGLMSYGFNAADSFRRAASFVVRVLQGGRPADMPVEQRQSQDRQGARPRSPANSARPR